MATELIQEVNETNKLISQLDANSRPIIQPAQAAAIAVKMNNMLDTCVVTPGEGSRVLTAIQAGPWSERELEQMTKALAGLMKPSSKGARYRPQHMKNFPIFLSVGRTASIRAGKMPFDKALQVCAQQLVDLECYIVAETTCGVVVDNINELGNYKLDNKELYAKGFALRDWVKDLKGTLMHNRFIHNQFSCKFLLICSCYHCMTSRSEHTFDCMV
jgi:hypothetical protein